MSDRSAACKYRPLRGGIRIVNGVVQEAGTLGLIALDKSGSPWIVSCYHVLARPSGWAGAAFASEEEVFQPNSQKGGSAIARTDIDRADSVLDCAAARIAAGVDVAMEVIGIGPLAPPRESQRDLRVIKYGAETGLTEGVITRVEADFVRIEPRPDFPDEYPLCAGGDSGALWVEQTTRAPVALHRAGNDDGAIWAKATPIGLVLESLRLTLV